ncbi:MAG: hypothetical protein H6814_10945 [Phycisphaeraceae bacterium]|nr:hypothetical protein [Phycisphaeraceae bacterium]
MTAMKAVVAVCAIGAMGPAAQAVNTATIDNITQGTNHATIQDANDNANPGDIIEIGAGVICESGILIDRALTIRGQGMDATTIDGQSLAGVMSWSGDTLTLQDLTIANGANSGFGGGLNIVAEVDAVAITGVRFLDNAGDSGGGIFCNGGLDPNRATMIEHCEFIGNAATGGGGLSGIGGGIMFGFQHVNATVINSLFRANTSGIRSAAVQASGQTGLLCKVSLINCTFVEHPLNGNGGDLLIFNQSNSGTDTDFQISNCVFDNNAAFRVRDNNSEGAYRNCVLGAGTVVAGFANDGGNTAVSPTFEDAPGGDYRLAAGSSGIDMGDSAVYLSAGGSLFDLADADRTMDDAGTPNTGVGVFPHLDAGAYEFQGFTPSDCDADINSDGVIDTADLGILLGVFGSNCP